MQQAVERVKGFYDVGSETQDRAAATLARVLETFRLADFRPIDVPVVEHLELYLRKNGAQVLPKVYAFVDQGKREVALRPEFTASVIRSLAAQAVAAPPLRVAYSGPVFRYEKPQRATGRQFTQAGVELLGDAGPAADAEIIALACRAARATGVQPLRLVLGHLAPLRALLSYLNVDGYAEQYLLEHLEYFNRGAEQQQAVRRRLGLTAAATAGETDETLSQSLANAVKDATPEEARRLVAAILDQMGVSLAGSTRSPEEILDRVLSKAQRRAAQLDGRWRDNLERALTFVERLGTLRGRPQPVLEQARTMLAEYGVPDTALAELQSVVTLLEAYDLSGVEIELAPGMARGIAYYTGLIFEIYADIPGQSPLQLCGGGRYDSLAQALTGRSCPALGFAFGLERLLYALQGKDIPAGSKPRLAVLHAEAAQTRRAQQLAERLRAEGYPVVVSEHNGVLMKTLDHVRSRGFVAAVVISGLQKDEDVHWLVDGRDAATEAALRRALTAPGTEPQEATIQSTGAGR